MRPVYLCDYMKNILCKRQICKGIDEVNGLCFCTFDEAFALRDERGKPIIFDYAPENDEEYKERCEIYERRKRYGGKIEI